MAGLQQVIASDAGKLYAAAEVVLSCPVSEDTGDAFIFGLYMNRSGGFAVGDWPLVVLVLSEWVVFFTLKHLCATSPTTERVGSKKCTQI